MLEGANSLFEARAGVTRIGSAGVVPLGAHLRAHAAATGRILWAGLTEDAVDGLLQDSIYDIRDRVRLARKEGVAVTDEELEVGMRSRM